MPSETIIFGFCFATSHRIDALLSISSRPWPMQFASARPSHILTSSATRLAMRESRPSPVLVGGWVDGFGWDLWSITGSHGKSPDLIGVYMVEPWTFQGSTGSWTGCLSTWVSSRINVQAVCWHIKFWFQLLVRYPSIRSCLKFGICCFDPSHPWVIHLTLCFPSLPGLGRCLAHQPDHCLSSPQRQSDWRRRS